ncbi:transporter substrate-binding domain-containing protein [Hahella sp. CR1]|uniref:substrate-binding periplasmic protein n=1 Tax=Hahella sp. CR1 TaxID=2992807 RepID=UPI0024432A8C|nr:transporter substrate-binding domain-containing protein [Hahella sp. CR1]MDG9669829.1 transporter substrate-binding domain-containing protein [Hahella sp. CR1]
MSLHLTRARQVFGCALCLILLSGWAEAVEYTLVTGKDSYPPFSGEDLPNGGLVTEIIQAVLERSGAGVKIEYLPWNRGFRLAEAGDVLGTFPYVKDRDRVDAFYFSSPLYVTVELFFVRRDEEIKYTSDEDLAGLVLCRPLGYSLESVQPLLDKDVVRLWTPNDLETCFQLLESKRVHLVPIGVRVGRSTIERLFGDPEHFRVLSKPLQVNGLHLIISRRRPDAESIMTNFNKNLSEMWKEGAIRKIYDKHHTQMPTDELLKAAP